MAGFFESLGLAKPPAQQQPQQQPNQGQQSQPQGDPNQGQQPNGQSTPNSQINGSNTPPDPMAAYAKMFDNNPNQNSEAAPSFSLDPKVLDQVTGSMDFMQGANQELVQKATNGDVGALMELMNHVGRKAYRSSLEHSSTLTDKFVNLREGHFSKGIPNAVREELTMGAITGSEGGVTSPVVRQQLVEIAKKIQKANPDASPHEVAQSARKYVSDLYNTMNPTTESQNTNANKAGAVNWDSYFDDSQS